MSTANCHVILAKARIQKSRADIVGMDSSLRWNDTLGCDGGYVLIGIWI